jgi:hypothetical protein
VGFVNASYNLRVIESCREQHPDCIEHLLGASAQQDTIGHLHLTAVKVACVIANRNQKAALQADH